ncbi:MAG: universal stress protein [archaeon]|nr:universal stress protein [archaeon]
MFDSILVAVDGSESNRVAVDTALKLARDNGSALTALSVFDPGGYISAISASGVSDEEEYKNKVCSSTLEYVTMRAEEEGVKLTTRVLVGNPAVKIIEVSEEYDLIICGTLGRTGLNRLIMGSVAEKVVRLSKCPVLVCRN